VDWASSLFGLATLGVGLAVVAALLWWGARSHSRLWRAVAGAYGGRAAAPMVARRAPDTIVIARRGAAPPMADAHRVHAGASIAAHEDGLSLTLLPPLRIMCPALFLPYDEMRLEPTGWALWPNPFAIRMRGLPGIDLILAEDTVQWLGGRIARAPFPAWTAPPEA
jgi:hypothetical protein